MGEYIILKGSEHLTTSYLIKIDAFEGPLDLLLHLINEYEIDIYDIPVAEVTEQYNEYIRAMKKLELNIASEYLVMAATLLSIKSQMLLPKHEIDEDIDEYEEDPREDLVRRLIEYRKYKEGAERLKELEQEASQVFMRPMTIFSDEFYKQEIKPGTQSVYDMLEAYDRMMLRKEWSRPIDTTVSRVEIPLEQRMEEIRSIVQRSSGGVLFDDLFTIPSKTHIVVTFIAILELMKNKEVYCEQNGNFEDLMIYEMQ